MAKEFKSLDDLLRKCLSEQPITATAKAIGVDHGVLIRYMQGRMLRGDTLQKLCDYFKIVHVRNSTTRKGT